MTRRPLHRSLVFWSGIVMMGFIIWAWSFSYRNLHIASYWRVETTHAAGGLAVMLQPRSTPLGVFHMERPIKINYGKHGEWIYDAVVPGDSAVIFPRLATYSDASDGSSSIFLPHWLMILVVGVGWLFFIVFLQRRTSRPLKFRPPQVSGEEWV